jgi:hypothetical protein
MVLQQTTGPQMNAPLEALIERVRALPAEKQNAAAVLLQEWLDEPYALSAEELAVLRPALADAQRGEHLMDLDDAPELNRPWS